MSRSPLSEPRLSPPVLQTINTLKRKEPDSEPPNNLPVGVNAPQGEYENGRVICEICGGGVSFRDEETDGFTLKHWDAHRQICIPPGHPTQPGGTVMYTPETAAEALANPPAKRRRAKRTEEERIEYLRADPYVAQFEAYRVLCASCDKWIRLRPNSTYCSIPWDAHRKSCLAKKINSKNVYALEERNALFTKDPDIRKFDSERVLCNICDKWIAINPEDHLQAVQKWLQHRASCQKPPSYHQPIPSTDLRAGHPAGNHPMLAGPSTSRIVSTSPLSPRTSTSTQNPHPHSLSHPESPSSFHDLNPANYAPAHESRRRNAEQRAATLRADNLIGEVEPNRVFCSLCQKWVQLRQDSSYCAYPWLQHRGKCLARHQRRAQKAAEIAEMRSRKQSNSLQEEDELISDNDEGSDDPESEEGVDSQAEERVRRREARRQERHKAQQAAKSRSRPPPHVGLTRHRQHPPTPHHGQHVQSSRASRPWDHGGETMGDADAEGDSYVEEENPPPRSATRPTPRRPWPVGLADLDSPSGRKNFIFASVDYLFATTYEASDDMSISALLTYLNSAMPQDKHEDFDTSEVIKAAAALQEKGRIVFEGDMLRSID